jgi:hypothetical protein
MPTRSEILVLESVLGFGFLGGFFTHVGLDPGEGVIKGLLKAIIPSNAFFLFLVIILISVAATAIGILGIFADAGKLGLFVIGSVWISGLIIPNGGTIAVIGLFLLIGAIFFGPVVYDIQNE